MAGQGGGPVISRVHGMQDSWDRLCLDTERARREGWLYGAKLVRGAYMQLERERARQKGYPSPIWDDIQQTHDNYNRHARLPASSVSLCVQ